MARLELRFRLSRSDTDTLARIEKVATPPPTLDDPSTRAIHFLRAVSGRAGICLSAFYLFLGAEASTDQQRQRWTYTQRLKHYTVRFSTIGTIALCIRSIFDHAGRQGLHARTVINLSPEAFESVSVYWADGDSNKEQDARLALALIQRVLTRCAVSINDAKKSDCILTRRVGLLKAYADRESAHISLHDYEYDLLDVAHVVAAMALLGAVIHHFDERSETGANYLLGIDQTAYAAGMEVFPELSTAPRLFDEVDVESMLRNLCAGRIMDGVDYLSTWLLSALGWDDMPKEFASQIDLVTKWAPPTAPK